MKPEDFDKIAQALFPQSSPPCHTRIFPLPNQVATLCEQLFNVLFLSIPKPEGTTVPSQLSRIFNELQTLVALEQLADTHGICEKFVESLPRIRGLLLEDAQAILDGDPAAQSLEEVVVAYPGFFAVTIYRLAHQLHSLKIPLVPRMMTEFAHQKTGIDIHPGATIGKRFCIDHGTGIVIGETTIIEENVKLYQGVTLGGLSVAKQMANSKRHPTIEKNVTIYANATILGGDTVIGHDSTIGGSVWITNSVAPFSRVYYKGSSHTEERTR